MSKLSLRITMPLGKDEPAPGFLARLALANGAPSLAAFSLSSQIPLSALGEGDDTAISALAELGSAERTLLAASTPTRLPDGHYMLRGQRFGEKSLIRTGARFCAACLREDLGRPRPSRWHARHINAHRRSLWTVAAVAACPVHRLELTVCEGWPRASHDFSRIVAELMPSLEEHERKSTRRDLSALEKRVVDRLNGGIGEVWLDRQALHAQAAICERLGVLATHGPAQSTLKLAADELRSVADTGLSIALQGPEAITSLLDRVHRAHVGDARSQGHSKAQMVYGQFYKSLAFQFR